MNGFYLQYDRRHQDSPSGLSVRISEWPETSNVVAPSVPQLEIFRDNSSQLVETGTVTAFCLGTFVYERQWGITALTSFAKHVERNNEFASALSGTHGQFCLVLHSPGRVLVVTDKLGTFPIYIYEDALSVKVSNLLCSLTKANHLTLNKQAVLEYLNFDYCFGGTFFSEIGLLQRGRIYEFAQGFSSTVYEDYVVGVDFGRLRSPAEAAEQAQEAFEENLSFLHGNDRIFVDITGGFDTRTNAIAMRHMGLPFEAGICGEQILGEQSLASEVARALGVRFHTVSIPDRDIFTTTARLHLLITGGVPLPYHSTELVYYYEYIRRSFDLHITGFAGSQLFDQFLPRLSLVSNRLNPTHVIQKNMNNMRIHDVFADGAFPRAACIVTLKSKIEKVFNEIGSNLHDEAASYLLLSSFNKYYHGTLVGTHNVILPFYCPFLEANVARLMIETPYKFKRHRRVQRLLLKSMNSMVSNMMTSHGYSNRLSASQLAADVVKGWMRCTLYDISRACAFIDVVRRYHHTVRTPLSLAITQRPFWVDHINSLWSTDLPIFDVLDRDKIDGVAQTASERSALRAKTIYLNWLIGDCYSTL